MNLNRPAKITTPSAQKVENAGLIGLQNKQIMVENGDFERVRERKISKTSRKEKMHPPRGILREKRGKIGLFQKWPEISYFKFSPQTITA